MWPPPITFFLSYHRGYTSAKVCLDARTDAARKVELDVKGNCWRYHGGLAEEEDYEVVNDLGTEDL